MTKKDTEQLQQEQDNLLHSIDQLSQTLSMMNDMIGELRIRAKMLPETNTDSQAHKTRSKTSIQKAKQDTNQPKKAIIFH